MDARTGELFVSRAAAELAGAKEIVEVVGTPEAVYRISKAVRAQHAAKRKAQKKARRLNR